MFYSLSLVLFWGRDRMHNAGEDYIFVVANTLRYVKISIKSRKCITSKNTVQKKGWYFKVHLLPGKPIQFNHIKEANNVKGPGHMIQWHVFFSAHSWFSAEVLLGEMCPLGSFQVKKNLKIVFRKCAHSISGVTRCHWVACQLIPFILKKMFA